jgi:hypothetical protein
METYHEIMRHKLATPRLTSAQCKIFCTLGDQKRHGLRVIEIIDTSVDLSLLPCHR